MTKSSSRLLTAIELLPHQRKSTSPTGCSIFLKRNVNSAGSDKLSFDLHGRRHADSINVEMVGRILLIQSRLHQRHNSKREWSETMAVQEDRSLNYGLSPSWREITETLGRVGHSPGAVSNLNWSSESATDRHFGPSHSA